MIGVKHIAVFIDEADVAGTHDRAGLARIDHGIGAQRLAIAAHHDIAGGRNDVVVVVVRHFVGRKPHDVGAGRRGYLYCGRGVVLGIGRRYGRIGPRACGRNARDPQQGKTGGGTAHQLAHGNGGRRRRRRGSHGLAYRTGEA